MKSCKYLSAEELPMILNVQEVSDFIGLGMSQTYVFILTGLVIETPFCHKRTSSILEDILQHFECGRFLGVFF